MKFGFKIFGDYVTCAVVVPEAMKQFDETFDDLETANKAAAVANAALVSELIGFKFMLEIVCRDLQAEVKEIFDGADKASLTDLQTEINRAIKNTIDNCYY